MYLTIMYSQNNVNQYLEQMSPNAALNLNSG